MASLPSASAVLLAGVAACLLTLSVSPSRCLAQASPGVQYTSLMACLSTKFPSLYALLKADGVDRAILRVLKSNASITIMAPTDAALAAYSPTCPRGSAPPTLTAVLLQHALKGKLTNWRFLNAGIRSHFPSYGAYPLTKLWTSPPLIGVVQQAGKYTSFARIMTPQICYTHNTMVHGINRVLYYCNK